jgi:TPP-dependent pyruvate/acetoin dehydrogenase alpha subunit
MLCDLAGKEGGTKKGRGGMMHVVDPARGVLGESGTLGGCLPIGLSIKVKEQDKVVLRFFGDGTSNRGNFHESANICGKKIARDLSVRE